MSDEDGNEEDGNEVRYAQMMKMANEYREQFPDVKHITAEEAMKRENVIFVDTRTEEERGVSMIENAIDVEEFERKIDKMNDCDVVCYCTIGYRSSMYVRQKIASNVDSSRSLRYYNLHGSVLAWTHAGGRLVDPKTGETCKRVHTFGRKWACAETSHEQIQFDQPVMAGFIWYMKSIYRRASSFFFSS